ncbi:hypothetical protein VTN00DRAFT_9231 [Thermoascus crustaceus]|uniref:uncharacterized protein n=1 Tax=Thermoascus crustaceus TaxID=5088 RepID=UPI0037438417
MAIMEKLAPISEHEATPSDHAFAAKGPYSTQQTEEVVSWIWDFSYIYSADTLGLDDSRPREGDVYLHKKRVPDILNPLPEYPAKHPETVTHFCLCSKRLNLAANLEKT